MIDSISLSRKSTKALTVSTLNYRIVSVLTETNSPGLPMTKRDIVWQKRLKAAALSLRLNDKTDEEISEQLTKRYKNQLKQALQTKSEDAFQLYINAFTKSYDPHTVYFSPRTSENFNINMSLSLEGIGAVLKSEEDHTSVVRLVPAGPADKEGTLEPTDKIIGVGQGKSGPAYRHRRMAARRCRRTNKRT